MSNIIGHTRHIEYFNTILQRGKLAHAYLFYGPEHVGKHTFARHVAKVFYCASLQKMLHVPRDHAVSGTFDDVCDSCSECKMIEGGRHPNVIFLDRDHPLASEKEARKDISIDDIRELRRKFSFAGSKNEMRIAIVNNAHTMSHEAAGAFLKMLEEPGAYTLFILIAPEKDALLQTIVSRTHPIYFASVPENVIREYIASLDLSSEDCAEFTRYGAGRPGVIINMFADAEYSKRERHMQKAVRFLLSKNDIPHALSLSEKIASDAALLSRARFALFSALHEELLTARNDQARRAVEKIKKANDIFSTIDTSNVQTRLALDALFLRI